MKSLISRAVRVVAAGLLLMIPAFGDYDAVRDFQSVQNAGAWSYGWYSEDGTFALFDTFATDTIYGTAVPGVNSWSFAGQAATVGYNTTYNTTKETLNYSTVNHPYDLLNLDPGAPGATVVVRFTAPAAGAYLLDAVFQDIDGNGHQPTATIYLGGEPSLSLFLPDYGGLASVVTPDPLPLAAGQTLDFGVRNEDIAGATGFNARISTVTAVPEPFAFEVLSLLLLAAGAGVHRYYRTSRL